MSRGATCQAPTPYLLNLEILEIHPPARLERAYPLRGVHIGDKSLPTPGVAACAAGLQGMLARARRRPRAVRRALELEARIVATPAQTPLGIAVKAKALILTTHTEPHHVEYLLNGGPVPDDLLEEPAALALWRLGEDAERLAAGS